MPTKPPAKVSTAIDIKPIKTRSIEVCILGTAPLIFNRMATKAQRELLLPTGRKTTADRAATLKHDPIAEFRDSPYTTDDPTSPTLLQFPAPAFKQAMEVAASDIEGVVVTKIRRNVWCVGYRSAIFGVPEMLMSVVRSADQNKTPDIRTRAIIPEWACRLVISFTSPMLNERSVLNLLAAAGVICGVGDWRAEKGSGAFGQFALVNDDDPRFLAILERGGRDTQIAAMANPVAFDAETQEAYSWFRTEVLQRGRHATETTGLDSTNGAVAHDDLTLVTANDRRP